MHYDKHRSHASSRDLHDGVFCACYNMHWCIWIRSRRMPSVKCQSSVNVPYNTQHSSHHTLCFYTLNVKQTLNTHQKHHRDTFIYIDELSFLCISLLSRICEWKWIENINPAVWSVLYYLFYWEIEVYMWPFETLRTEHTAPDPLQDFRFSSHHIQQQCFSEDTTLNSTNWEKLGP